MDVIGRVLQRITECEAQNVEILCCPEAVIGGLAHESNGQVPGNVALRMDDGEFADVVAPLLDTAVTVIIGFTERDQDERLFSSAAVLDNGRVSAVYRKVYPGYRTAISAGDHLPLFRRGSTPYGIIVCNDICYIEPTRILAAAGAALIFVPTNSGHLTTPSKTFRARGRNLAVARAVENSATVIVADIAGQQHDRHACGLSAIIDPDGITLAQAETSHEELIIADVEASRRPHRGPRGWDGHTNPAVTRDFIQLWR
jgi:predicted amidohydrolase